MYQRSCGRDESERVTRLPAEIPLEMQISSELPGGANPMAASSLCASSVSARTQGGRVLPIRSPGNDYRRAPGRHGQLPCTSSGFALSRLARHPSMPDAALPPPSRSIRTRAFARCPANLSGARHVPYSGGLADGLRRRDGYAVRAVAQASAHTPRAHQTGPRAQAAETLRPA